jgi:hypothetical protein
MVESIYFLKPAWYGTHFAGRWPEQGFQHVTRATALRRWFSLYLVKAWQPLAAYKPLNKTLYGQRLREKYMSSIPSRTRSGVMDSAQRCQRAAGQERRPIRQNAHFQAAYFLLALDLKVQNLLFRAGHPWVRKPG